MFLNTYFAEMFSRISAEGGEEATSDYGSMSTREQSGSQWTILTERHDDSFFNFSTHEQFDFTLDQLPDVQMKNLPDLVTW